MVIALALLLSFARQDTNTVLSPKVRAMLDQFPPPHGGQPSITVRFSRDTVWLGEQVEMVTAIWFPRQLRDRLRRQPAITPPSLTGLWSARNQQQPVQAGTRVVGSQLYDLYVSYQTIFPLGAGRIVAPPAVLSYGVPVSTSYFAPEERRTLQSPVATLMVRAPPAAVAAAVGTGPTAHNLRIAWRGPAGALHVGAPTIVELVVSGEGNLTLWPTPQVGWPVGVHVYPEPTDEHVLPDQGVIAGEKHFRFTLVADTAGVLTLPVVTYAYFDPATVTARTISTGVFEMPVLPRTGEEVGRHLLPVRRGTDIPLATTVRQHWWPILLLLVVAAPWPALRRRRPRALPAPALPTEPELALRQALGTPVDAAPDRVVAALRLRGVAREDAEHIHRWLSANGRRRYGLHAGEAVDPPVTVARVLARLRQPAALLLIMFAALPLRGEQGDAIARYQSGDYDGAARVFNHAANLVPDDATAWADLGAARWMQQDDVRAAAAWLTALRLTPRDGLLQQEWAQIPAVPSDIRSLAPTLPLSRDELLVICVLAWCLAWLAAAADRRRAIWGAAGLCAAALLVCLTRWRSEHDRLAIVATNTTLHISPQLATMAIGDIGIWTPVHVVRSDRGWVLVQTQLAAPGLALATATEGWLPINAVATIGPLD